ncbi:MAG: polysaccharide deacetylase family protein [Hyphomicrobiaceae bacterium]|nr:polysaccharide deacetylase family protein [Hyphomicrobiaceae bacterium]
MRAAASRQAGWAPVREELARWQDAQCVARLWLRDDDAVAVTPLLIRLSSLCAGSGVPWLVAAVPCHASEELAGWLAEQPLAEAAAHGWTHRNHAMPGARKQEFPVERPGTEIRHELGLARARLGALFGAKGVPILVPPWNRIGPEVAALLPDLGYRALSTLGRKPVFQAPAPIRELNAHIDIIDWRGSRGGGDPDELAAGLARELAWARGGGQPAVGILTHHLVHDTAAWRFLEELFAETASHGAVRWSRASELIGAGSRSA